jgi:hypothetical protein
MKKNTIFSTAALLISYVLFALDMNLGAGITSNRVGLFFSSIVLLMGLTHSTFSFTTLPYTLKFILITGFLFTVLSLMSAIQENTIQPSLYRSLNYFFLSILGIIFYINFKVLTEKHLLFVGVFFFIIVITYIFFTIYWISSFTNLDSLFTSPWKIRARLNELPGGLNKFAFGFWIITTINTTTYFYKASDKYRHTYIVLSMLGIAVLLLFMSRQIILLTLTTGFLFSISTTLYNKKTFTKKTITVLTVVVMFFLIFLGIDFFQDHWFIKRILVTGTDVDRSYNMRMESVILTVNSLAHFPFLGTGPGTFLKYTGIAVDNGFLLTLGELGVPSFFLLIVWLSYLLKVFLVRIFSYKHNSLIKYISSAGISCCILSLLFNDIFTSAIYWASCGLLLGLLDNNSCQLKEI